jgi:hypothetical protein
MSFQLRARRGSLVVSGVPARHAPELRRVARRIRGCVDQVAVIQHTESRSQQVERPCSGTHESLFLAGASSAAGRTQTRCRRVHNALPSEESASGSFHAAESCHNSSLRRLRPVVICRSGSPAAECPRQHVAWVVCCQPCTVTRCAGRTAQELIQEVYPRR